MTDVWTCKIGWADRAALPPGSDAPMRDAVERAFRELTGHDAKFTFSGWGGSLTEGELACVEDRLPDPEVIIAEQRKALDDALDHMNAAQRVADELNHMDGPNG